MNRQTRLTSTQVYNLKVGDRPWVHDRFEVVPRHIGKVVKVTDTQVHVEVDYGMNGGSRDSVHKYHRLDKFPGRIRAGWQLDSTKEMSLYGIATPQEIREYEKAIRDAVASREQHRIAKEKREAYERRINAELPANMVVNKLDSGKWDIHITEASFAIVKAIGAVLETGA